jgi:hypothetical protein
MLWTMSKGTRSLDPKIVSKSFVSFENFVVSISLLKCAPRRITVGKFAQAGKTSKYSTHQKEKTDAVSHHLGW